VVDLNDVIGGGIGEDLLSFTLTGELVKTSHDTRNVHHYACPFRDVAIPTVSPETSLGAGLGDMLVKSVVCEGVTVVNDEGFPPSMTMEAYPRVAVIGIRKVGAV